MSVLVERMESRLFNGTVADEMIASLTDAIQERGRASLVLAGGMTPGGVYRQLSIPPRVDDLDWSKVWMYWGDERFVPHSDGRSNFKMVQETLLSQLGERSPKVLPVDTSLSSVEEAAAAYGELICREEKLSPGQLPVFDLVLLGIGEDGHTASLFPGSPLIQRTGGICFSDNHPSDGSQRVTLSVDAILAARRIAYLVKGESKADIVREVLEGAGNVDQYPANIYRRASGQVTWFLDSGAALKLAPERAG